MSLDGSPRRASYSLSTLNSHYQLFAYGKKYGCEQVALIYPKTDAFRSPIHYEFDEDLSLSCFPFDVTEPEDSVKDILEHL